MLVKTQAEIIAVGDEVLAGEVINTNAATLSGWLLRYGIRPIRHTVVPDDPSAIADAVRRALEHSQWIVVVGGLGPTWDDVTIDGVAQALQRRIIVDERVRQRLMNRPYHHRGWEDAVARQSRVIDGAEIGFNPRGQAPGQWVTEGHQIIVLLPGPPRELEALLDTWLSSRLAKMGGTAVERLTLSLFDWGESTVAAHVRPLLAGPVPHAGIYAKPGRVDIRLQMTNDSWGRVTLERAAGWVTGTVPGQVYRLGSWSREHYLIYWLTTHHLTLAAMESLTGGSVLSRLIDVPGASQVIVGGSVTYTDHAKVAHGVNRRILEQFGAVSEACARDMARAIRETWRTDVGVATTGFAGPSGGTDHDPVGTYYVAVSTARETLALRRYMPLGRDAVRQAAVESVLSALWQALGLPTDIHHVSPPVS
ncbi:MAG: nicotinamide-nucleotide amidohydrolase family protein [Sulfobacillus sp.]|nr:nicotinamide-nucleotide amidohydrolase family protein [Sulfobacillus sp.]